MKVYFLGRRTDRRTEGMKGIVKMIGTSALLALHLRTMVLGKTHVRGTWLGWWGVLAACR